jgi:hypothetical protein
MVGCVRERVERCISEPQPTADVATIVQLRGKPLLKRLLCVWKIGIGRLTSIRRSRATREEAAKLGFSAGGGAKGPMCPEKTDWFDHSRRREVEQAIRWCALRRELLADEPSRTMAAVIQAGISAGPELGHDQCK